MFSQDAVAYLEFGALEIVSTGDMEWILSKIFATSVRPLSQEQRIKRSWHQMQLSIYN